MNFLSLENEFWEAARDKCAEKLLELISDNAVVISGGLRYSGRDYADHIRSAGVSDFSVHGFETVVLTDELRQNHYIVSIAASSENNAISGSFHITSTWKYFGGSWKLVFGMDCAAIN